MQTNQWMMVSKKEFNMRPGKVSNTIIGLLAADRLGGLNPNRLRELIKDLNKKEMKKLLDILGGK